MSWWLVFGIATHNRSAVDQRRPLFINEPNQRMLLMALLSSPTEGPCTGTPARTSRSAGVSVWPPQLSAIVSGLVLFAAARIRPAFKFLGRSNSLALRPQEDPRRLSSPAAPASVTGPTRRLPCKLRPCKLLGAQRTPRRPQPTAQGLTINYNLVMFGAKTIGGDDLNELK